MILKEVLSKSAITKSKLPVADYVANAYIGCPHKCIYCYAEFMRRFTNHYEAWGDFIDIKIFDKIKLPKDIENKSITISSVTDPYNPYEITYKKTQQILEALKNSNCNVGILTKSKNVLRDIPLFKQFKNIEVGVSLNTVDDSFRKRIEPAASTVEGRINVLKTLREHGIKNWLFMSPMFPFLSDYKKIIERTKDFVDYYGFENLNLRAGYKFRVLSMIEQKYNHLYKYYKEIYIKGNTSFWNLLEKEITAYCEDNNIEYRMYFYHEKIKKK
ncbi:MAG: radical SAM protein [Spirochaetaceae bacterium]|jgi:DNA repair photolyase|nr:radical SAM protein [Spirochaetaceae bacterium]